MKAVLFVLLLVALSGCTQVSPALFSSTKCDASSGYSWCAVKNKCVIVSEEPCNISALSMSAAYGLAEKSFCNSAGVVSSSGIYDPVSSRWFFNLSGTSRPDCSPSCVVNGDGLSIVISWNCPVVNG